MPHDGSLPVRGAWVEITLMDGFLPEQLGRSPCGERGLKLVCNPGFRAAAAVAPRAGSVG